MRAMIRQLRPAIVGLAICTVLCGALYPLIITAVAQTAFHSSANGSLIVRDGQVVGSELLGQSFVGPGYFHSRPSAAGSGYDGAASAASNFGPTNTTYLGIIARRADDYRAENGLPSDAIVPADAVQASGSGLDPLISTANADLQARRVARERGIDPATVSSLIEENTERASLGILGDPGVNVVRLNLALDEFGKG